MTDDRGFSLTELIVVLVLMLLILVMAFSAIRVIYASRDVTERQAMFASKVGGPLAGIEEAVQQALTIKAFSAYSVSVVTDLDNDNSLEWQDIALDTNGVLTQKVYRTDSAGNKTTLRTSITWSRESANRAQAQPLFRLFDATGAPIAVTTGAKEIEMTIVVQSGDKSFKGARRVTFRNL